MATQLKIIRTSKQVQGFVEKIDGVPLDMIFIPSGTFMMGAPETEEESLDRERPQHLVNVSSFFMGRYPITQAQWRVIASLELIGRELDLDSSRFKGENRPVERVSWQDAIEFCARLSRHTQKNYRLPSEAEWEYACRAGTTTPFHFGETISTELANYRGTDWEYQGKVYPGNYGRGEKGVYREETTDVTLFSVTNAFGLSEMHGNVWEWCLDPWYENYNNAPNDGSVWDKEYRNDNRYQNLLANTNVLNRDERSHILRGGSWYFNQGYCRSAYRDDSGNFDFSVGFRVVCLP